MSFTPFIAGFILLLNPNINMIDLLPDFIGFILIYGYLKKLSYINDYFDEAKIFARRLLILSLVKIPLTFFSLSLKDATTTLLFTLCFAVAELVLIIPFINNVFSGMDSLSERTEKTSFKSDDRVVKSFTYIFFFVKNILTLLPELLTLYDKDNSPNYDPLYSFDPSRYKTLATFAAFLITLICALYFGSQTIKYLISFKKDGEINALIKADYQTKVLENEGVMRFIYSSAFCSRAMLFSVFSLVFCLENINILPGFIGGIIILCSVGKFEKLFPKRTKAAAVLFILFDLCAFLYRGYYVYREPVAFYDIFTSKPLTIPLALLTFISYIILFYYIASAFEELALKYAKTEFKVEKRILLLLGTLLSVSSFFFYALPSFYLYISTAGQYIFGILLVFFTYKYSDLIKESLKKAV